LFFEKRPFEQGGASRLPFFNGDKEKEKLENMLSDNQTDLCTSKMKFIVFVQQ